jgi:NAD+ diphosphatase
MPKQKGEAMNRPIPFAGDPLDRASNQRKDPEWLEKTMKASTSRFLPFAKFNVLTHDTDQPELLWLDSGVRERLGEAAPAFLLGLRDDVAHFALDVSVLEDPLTTLELSNASFAEVRGIALRLPAGDAGTLAHARALLYWHDRHRFCGACGQPTSVLEGGSMRKCPSCDAEHFPRTDPAVIMVVWKGDRCLLGRQKAWAPGSYSALAGFVDQGETIEEAVCREVEEEVSLKPDNVEYFASQPWPFPSSLMIGCFAHVTDEDHHIDPQEIDDARWFTRDEVKRAVVAPDPALGFSVPGPIAIAHYLIKAWSEQVHE